MSNGWKTISYESIDIRDGLTHEVVIEKFDRVDTKRIDKKTKKPETACKYDGFEMGRGPVSFLATDHLAEQLGHETAIGKLVRVTWRGKKQMSDGKTFNVFAVDVWEGDLPDYAIERKLSSGPATAGFTQTDDFPET